MNVVKILGGLGNQMFQYAFGRVLYECGNNTAYDLSWYHQGKHLKIPEHPRHFRLDKFEITNMNFTNFIDGNARVYESSVGFNINLLKSQNFNFEGYWQYLGYYDSPICLSIFRKEFQLRSEFYTDEFLKMADEIMNEESVSMHVRRGDYLLTRNANFKQLPFKYYYSAMKGVPGHLYIFSDDIPWCKETFTSEYFDGLITFVDMEDYLSFELMRLCKHNIIANSTFSWWAAYLNDNPGKVVICPMHWLDESEPDEGKHYPRNWIRFDDYIKE